MQENKLKIGLEIHLYPETQSKMFCSCSADFMHAKEANQNICPICTAHPGSKPMAPNKEAILKSLVLAKLMQCAIAGRFAFLRKHYFYPDLPSNYQRTSTPYATDGVFKNARIREIHVEEDPGQFDLRKGTVDFNRSGTPLIEMVTEPDFHSARDVRRFLEELKLLLEFIQLTKQETTFKVDTNVSVMDGERVEVKNVNSIKDVGAAIIYEEKRQMRLVSQGQKVERETRHFDTWSQETARLRAKEDAADYRYLKDPDLGTYSLESLAMPNFTHPFDLQKELARTYGIDETAALHLVINNFYGNYKRVAEHLDPSFVANWFLRDLKPEIEKRNLGSFEDAAFIIKLLHAVQAKKVTSLAAKDLLRETLDGRQVTFSSEQMSMETLDDLIENILKVHADAAESYKKGKTASLNFLVGMVSKEVKKQVDANQIRSRLEKKLKSADVLEP